MNKYFYFFVVLVILQKTEYLISLYTGIMIFNWFAYSPFLLIAGNAVIGLWAFRRKVLLPSDAILNLLLALVILLAFYGFFRGNEIAVIQQELATAVVVLYGYVLGLNRVSVFTSLPLRVLLVIAILLTLAGVPFLRGDLAGEVVELVPTATVAYEISPILDLWALMFLIAFFKNEKKVLVFVPVIAYLGFQLFFLKRAPSARALTIVVFAFSLRGLIAKDLLSRVGLGLMIIATVTLFYNIMPSQLKERFATSDSARQREVKAMFSQMSDVEVVLGKGLGGGYELYEGAGIVRMEDGTFGKHIVHIGVAYPVLKGGVLMLILVLFHYFLSLMRGLKNARRLTPEQLAAMVYLFVYGTFRVIEGPFSPGAIFDGISFGYALGVLWPKANPRS